MMLLALTGPQALASTKARLGEFGVKGPFRVQRLSRFGVDGNPNGWSLALTAKDGTIYEAYLGAEGRFRSLRRRSFPALSRKSSIVEEAQLLRWLGRVRPRFSLRRMPAPFGAPACRYEAIVAGYPFVDSPYGYTFAVDKGEFVGFDARENLPPLGPSRPRLARTDAEKAAPRIFKRYFVPGRVEYVLDSSRTSLAWLEAEGAPGAVLVWRVTGMPKILGGDWTKVPHAVEVYIDALSGTSRERRRGH